MHDATPLIVAGRRIVWMHQAFVTGAGVLSFSFGLLLAYRIGISDGLLMF